MARRNLYEILGVGPDASDGEIRAAFRRLTRELHPDRFTGEERRRAEERFQEITEAFNVLSRPHLREKYDAELARGRTEAPRDPREVARLLAARGAQQLREGNLPGALETLDMAIRHDDGNARAHYFYGLALQRVPGRTKEAARHLERAAALEPTNPTIAAEAARIFLALGMQARARRFAEQALSLDPTNAKASGVLAEVEGAAASEGGSGLLGGLLGKRGRA